MTHFVAFSVRLGHGSLSATHLPVSDGCRTPRMDLWAFSLTKEPFHNYQQSVNHQLSEEPATAEEDAANDSDFLERNPLADLNKVPRKGTHL